jgi:hypothetical protein
MLKRLAAITFIFICTSIAWAVLAATVFTRTYNYGTLLRDRVTSVWGSDQKQMPASVSCRLKNEDGREICRFLPLEKSGIHANLNLEHRQKGLLWFNTFQVGFEGEYEFRNDTGREVEAQFRLPLPAARAVYDDLALTRDGVLLPLRNHGGAAETDVRVAAGEILRLRAAYRSQGLNQWQYTFGEGPGQVRNFTCSVKTNFRKIDFPDNTLAPTAKHEVPQGWDLEWNYRNLVSGVPIAVVMPGKTQPGPLAGEISSFAPVSLFFFFFLLLVITTLKNIDLHPMNYFFLACAFFSFHLLLAYLVDHISIHAAFFLCSAVSILLVVSYLRLVVGLRFALVEAGLAQFVYLVLFSYAFFFEGYTGLTVTLGAIVTLFCVMQLTARINWAEKFRPAGSLAAAGAGSSPPGR